MSPLPFGRWLMTAGVAATATGAALGLASCASNEPDPFDVAPMCSSGIQLDPDEQPSEQMAPGRACNACHVDSNLASGDGDAPVFAFAGTVYPTGHEPDDCAGMAAAGAVVTVTDANGTVSNAAVNAGGNFSLEVDGFAFPFRASVSFAGRTRTMEEPSPSGDCNGCHTQRGTTTADRSQFRLAPGRILLP